MKSFYNNLKNTKIIFFVLVFQIINYSLSAQLFADNLRNGDAIIQEMIMKTKLHAVNSINLEPDKRTQKIKQLINQYINLNFMARATTGSFWKKATEKQRKLYKDALFNQIINTIEDHLNTLATLSYKSINSELRGKKLVYIRGKIEDPKKIEPTINLLWKLAANKDGKFLVLDLEIEGISLISSHKAETMSILRKNKGDFNILLSKLKESK
ncbi:ABC transporter substrate-binding protein [Alphaproteobacteria bacterium]|nr:ABC transporter substrate-binding protein [Alphaproteobacteria bacterium]